MPHARDYLIEILVPKMTGDGEPVARTWFDGLTEELTKKFGGVTSFVRQPGEGLWDKNGEIESDAIAIIEVMTGSLDENFWQALKQRIEKELSQEEVVIRAHRIERL
jgi:hypothetical protein